MTLVIPKMSWEAKALIALSCFVVVLSGGRGGGASSLG